MKKFSYSELAIIFAAPTMLAMIPKHAITNKVSSKMDSLMPTSNYTMIDNDIIGYDSLRFSRPGAKFETLDLSFNTLSKLLWQLVIPSSIASRFQSQSYDLDQAKTIYDAYQRSTWTQSVDILDARDRALDFNRTGFDLITDEAFSTFDWDNIASAEVQEKLHNMMAPIIDHYYPNATSFFIGPPIKRHALSLKATNGPHMDYVPDDEMREAFYANNEIPTNQKIVQCLMGKGHCKQEDEELGAILGAWLPTMNTPVCDKPLAIMDSSTSSPNDVTTITASVPSMKLWTKPLSQMFAIVNFNPLQRWYYYSYQTPNEMLLFHHYKRDKTHVWGNPHSSFMVSGCGDEYETRGSTEMRIAVFFEKEKYPVQRAR